MNEAKRKTYAALLNPRVDSGEMDYPAFENQIRFLTRFGLDGFAINGATGEMPGTSEDELKALLEAAGPLTSGREVFCCIGSSTLHGVISRARIAADAHVDAVLLPMPYFFPYDQNDAIAFCEAVTDATDLPILLYNLPQFTTGFETATVLRLMDRYSQIIGIKDSSGSLETVRELTERRIACRRLIGNDGVLCDAIRENVCDGVISGVACVLPELTQNFFDNAVSSPEFARSERLLREFLDRVAALPTPWGLKCTSESRHITHASYPLPLGSERKLAQQELAEWFVAWMKCEDWNQLHSKMDYGEEKGGLVYHR